MELIKLHLGCWHRHFPGWVHVDLCDMPHIDVKSNIDDLSMFENGSAGIIYASHALSYFDRVEAKRVLAEWRRVLAPEGILRLAVPDFEALIEVYRKSGELKRVLGPLYGRMEIQSPSGPRLLYHKTVYDFSDLSGLLEECGFTNVRRYRWQDASPHREVDDHSQAYYPHIDKENGIPISLNVEADKA